MKLEIKTDYDNINFTQLKKIMNRCKIIYRPFLREAYFRQSSSNKGYHCKYVFWFPDEYKNIDLFSFKLGLRFCGSDDNMRIKLDIERHNEGRKTDRLWQVKNGKVANPFKLYWRYEKDE